MTGGQPCLQRQLLPRTDWFVLSTHHDDDNDGDDSDDDDNKDNYGGNDNEDAAAGTPCTDWFVLLTNRVLITMMRPVLVMTVMNMILVNYLESGSKTCSLHNLRNNQNKVFIKN